MLLVMGEKENIETLQVLSMPFKENEESLNTRDSLRKSYLKLINEMQPHLPFANELFPSFVLDKERIQKFINVFSIETSIDDTYYDMSLEETRRYDSIYSSVKNAIKNLGEKYPPFEWIFNLALDSIIFSSSKIAVGGTASSLVGALWINPRENWTDNDIYEFLIHELGHTLLFLNEWRYGLFTSEERLNEKETYGLSAIRSQLRPMDKAFHSAVVATEVLLLREYVIGHEGEHHVHPDTKDLIPMVRKSIQSIRSVHKRENILTENALLILDQCERKLNQIRQEDTSDYISRV
ncbi:hypothetical protein LCM10_08090 [Rossellomorea aquimaris]|uniref:aKG-HExxH-type peptide beta-hydroxylase n=1 Tax=Rossellomorea aquimaris TaxID=189382 RepID=UPI001CD72977|nr:HEXXH motif-containing putative peptide modification protein [Rossellomorea aquimaris]MCA1054942.1 hypothetical protein [Rossellomorea aquimaris]